MEIRRHLTYANVAATLALAGVIGGGAAYAGGLIGSRDVANNSLRSVDLKNRQAVKGRDVKRNSLRGSEVNEKRLDARGFSAMAGSQELECDPTSSTFINCATTTVSLKRPGRILVVATGAAYSEGAAAHGTCEVRVNGADAPLSQTPGEETTDNTSALASDGFARTLVTGPHEAGDVEIALACNQVGGADFRIDGPTIVGLGLTNG